MAEIQLTIDDKLLAQIDAQADASFKSRAAFIRDILVMHARTQDIIHGTNSPALSPSMFGIGKVEPVADLDYGKGEVIDPSKVHDLKDALNLEVASDLYIMEGEVREGSSDTGHARKEVYLYCKNKKCGMRDWYPLLDVRENYGFNCTKCKQFNGKEV